MLEAKVGGPACAHGLPDPATPQQQQIAIHYEGAGKVAVGEILQSPIKLGLAMEGDGRSVG